jgi:uncharacterized membrane protein HdeD (DUF308 family)
MKRYKLGWIIPAIIIIVNTCAIWISWSSLPQTLPAHFDPQGNASGSMARTTLLFYPVISLVLCLAAYVMSGMACKKCLKADDKGLRLLGAHFLTSAIALTILSSTMVTLTFGTQPLFMFAEPVIIIAGIAACVICLIKARK